jgi:hypothetical protein
MNHSIAYYPATLETGFPPHYDRVQVLYRVLLLVAIGFLHQMIGSLGGILFLFLPLVAAMSIVRNGGIGLRSEEARSFINVIDWAVSFYAYFLFVIDRFPLARERDARVAVEAVGSPRVGAALLRLVTTLPHAIVLGVLGIAAALVAVAMGISVLVTGKAPESLYTFQRDVVAWIGRVLAYHSSLVDTYPPFALTSGDPTHVHQ